MVVLVVNSNDFNLDSKKVKALFFYEVKSHYFGVANSKNMIYLIAVH